jgi:hypothetical protein
LTSEQLQSARAERWRQVSNPVLTADDARAWLDGIGFCLFLSRRSHASGIASGPAPSFVEAVEGAPSEASSREAIENATALMHRLAAEGSVVPLNLSGAASAFGNGGAAGIGASDQLDFLVTRAALPYVFSLIGGRNWKSGPGAKASPLMTEVWTLLNEKGARTAAEIQTELGRELTEAAVLRALVELWHGLRVIPVYDGETTRWELTQARFAAEMTASQKVAQTTALSALVSLYLEAAVAASSEEIETFLSPLASRSRVREVVNGLSATRQLGLISVAAQPLLHIAGSLPEFAEEPVKPEGEPRTGAGPRAPFQRREAGLERRPAASEFARKPREAREGGGARRPFERGRSGPARERGSRERTGPPRERTGLPRDRAGFGRARGDAPFRPKSGGERPYRKSFGAKTEGGERRPFGKKPFDKKSFGSRPSGGPRSFDRERPGAGGERRSGGSAAKFGPRKFGAGAGGARPWRDRGSEGEAGRGAERGSGKLGSGKKFEGADRKEFGGPRKPGAAKKFGGSGSGGTEFRGAKFDERGRPGPGARAGSRPPGSGTGQRAGGAGRGSFSGGFKREKPGEKRPFFRERPAKGGDGESRERGFRADSRSEGEGAAKRTGGWKPKAAGGGFSKAAKPGFGRSSRPAFKGTGKPGFKSGGKTGFGGAGSGKSGRPTGKPGRPASGGKKPGGFKPPFRKRKEEGGENAG